MTRTITNLRWLLMALILLNVAPAAAQSLPGDSLVYGPVFSPVYNDSVQVWILTKNNTNTGNTLSLEVKAAIGGTPLTGTPLRSNSRLGYNIRSFKYGGLAASSLYNAAVKANGTTTIRTSTVKTGINTISDFEWLAGGCGRIMDMTRCVDQVEGPKHTNGSPNIYKRMANDSSDLMVWLGDAVYLFGIEHSDGLCTGMVNDWDNRNALFSRFFFNRQFHDTLMRAMPQLAITDNHDVGGNEFNKTMATLDTSLDNFKDWWPNPRYISSTPYRGLYSSYRYKDVEFFLLDNRSYRESTTRHLGHEQLIWLEQALLSSTAPFKVLISGTPSFNKAFGGRNFSITTECDTLLKFVKANNINGLMCYSADIHNQQFYGNYTQHTYPFFDILSGNLASDIGTSSSVNYNNDDLFNSNMQTYMRSNIYGAIGDRRYKVEYVSPQGIIYFSSVIHEDMLKSIDDSTKKLSLSFSNNLYDSSKYHRVSATSGTTFGADKDNNPSAALVFNGNGALTVPHTAEMDMHDRTFSITYWVKPTQFATSGYSALLSNTTGANGFTIGLDATGHPMYINHSLNAAYTATEKINLNKWSHIAWKYDNVKLQLSFYLNGLLLQKWTGVNSPAPSAAALTIGNSALNKPFTGSVDELNTYGKLIADKLIQVQSGYKATRGTAISLPGSQNMYIPSALVNPVFSGSFSVEFWARFTGSGISGPLVSCHGRINNYTRGWDIEFTNNKPNLVFGNNTTTGWLKITEAGYAWQTAEWNHIAFTAVPNDSLYLYVNGVKVGSVKYTTFFDNTFNFGLGKSSQYGSTAQIEMDEFRIWNAALPVDSFKKRMHYKLSGNESNLAFYYDFSAYTDTTIRSNAANTTELLLTGATLTESTAPVAAIAPAYRNRVKGNWTIAKNSNSGLNLEDAITNFNSNLVLGRNTDSTIIAATQDTTIQYVKGAWQLDALNQPTGNLKLNLSEILPQYDSISHLASEFYLLKKDSLGLQVANTGYFDGTSLSFPNTYLDSGIYHLGWKADTAATLFDRGGALSMLGSHVVNVPYTAVNNALSGAFTIEFWSRLTRAYTTNVKLLANNNRINNLSRGFSIELGANGHTINATVGNNGTGWSTINSGTDFNIGEWNHIALTGTPNGSMKLYINGGLADSLAFTSYFNNQVNLSLGTSINYGNECISMMDELRIWNKAKTQQEIQNTMHLTADPADTSLKFNYTFNQPFTGYVKNYSQANDSVTGTNVKIIPSTSPVGIINVPQRHRVNGSWSVRDSSNGGLNVQIAIPDYDANLVIGKDSLSGKDTLLTVQNGKKLRRLWQLDPLKVSAGSFVFSGPAVLSANWTVIKNNTLEYYLLKKNAQGQMTIQAIGSEQNDQISFSNVNFTGGLYTLGWKYVNGFIDTLPQPLPLNWGAFSARIYSNTANIVEWQTLQESNTAYFQVERAADGAHFQPVGRQDAKGAASGYSFIDNTINPAAPVYYYRIKQVDVSNRYAYSAIAYVNRNAADGTAIQVMPNPARSTEMMISLQNGKETAAHVTVTDASGKTILSQDMVLNTTGQKFLPHATPGIYFVSVTINRNIISQKLVVE